VTDTFPTIQSVGNIGPDGTIAQCSGFIFGSVRADVPIVLDVSTLGLVPPFHMSQ